MKSSSSSTSETQLVSSSSSSTSETQLVSSSSSSPLRPPRPSLQSPELQREFLQEHRNKFCSHSDVVDSSPTSPLPSPFSPTPSFGPTPSFSPTPSSSPSSPGVNIRPARLSLSSPELLSELKESRTRPLRRVPAHNGMTTVFSGRGGQPPGPAPSTRPANQGTSSAAQTLKR